VILIQRIAQQLDQESAIESQLSSTRREFLRDELQARVQALQEIQSFRRDGLSEIAHEQLETEQDADDATQQAGHHEVEAALIDHEKQELIELRNAIQRIDGNDYGICIRCKQTIAYERLQQEPQTERCEACEAANDSAA
jgi:DnaK suppressor protein